MNEVTELEVQKPKPTERNLVIDNYRGWVIFIVFVWCCVFLNLGTDKLPLFFFHTDKYGKDVAFGIMDYGMSFFMCAAGMTFKLVFEKRKKEKGASEAYLQSVKRGFGVMGIGMFDLIAKDFGDGKIKPDGKGTVYGWEVFATIGFASVFATIFINMRKRFRLTAGILIIIAYGLAYAYIPYVKLVGGYPNLTYGGPIMAIACSGLILIFSVAGELMINKQYWLFLGLYIGSWIVAIPSIVFTANCGEDYSLNPDYGIWGEMLSISFSKARAGFLIMSVPVSLTPLIIIWAITDWIKKPFILLADMGRNTIIFFFLFGLTYLLTAVISPYLVYLWADIIVSTSIAVGVCIGVNMLLKLLKFNFTV